MRTTKTDVALDLEQLSYATLEDPVLMREIVQALIDDLGRQAGLLHTAVAEEDASRTVRLARHSARACQNVGAHRATATLRSIEQIAGIGELAGCSDLLFVLRAEIETLEAEAARL